MTSPTLTPGKSWNPRDLLGPISDVSRVRTLPLGFPKCMVTPVAATAAVQWYVAESDIAMYPTIGDISLNRVTRSAMTNAAYAVAAMARAWSRQDATARVPLLGVSSFGN